MVIIKLQGGLGNQLFQWAFATALEKFYNTEVRFALDTYTNDQPFHNRPKLHELLPMQDKYITVYKKPFWNYFKRRALLDLGILYPGDTVLQGYFDDPHFWIYMKHEIQDTLRTAILDRGKPDFAIRNAVAVHVRRGDFVDNPHHQVCDLDYYWNAIEQLNKRVKDPTFLFFSDDPLYCHDRFNYLENRVFVDTKNDIADLAQMICCDHFIISNSSFSWWGQFLSCNPNKIVIFPPRWNNGDDKPYLLKKW